MISLRGVVRIAGGYAYYDPKRVVLLFRVLEYAQFPFQERNLYFLMINGFLSFFFDHSRMEVKESEGPFNRFGNHFLEKDFLE